MPINAIYDQFEEIRDQIQEILDGHRTLSLFCGPPGIGKTFTVELMLRAAGIKNLRPVTANDAPSFVKLLWDHQEQPAVFLDDCDALATKSECAMIAKKAFGPDRRVVWDSTAARNNQLKGGSHELIPPPDFHIKCGLIWCSNKNFTDEKILAAHMVPDFQALCSRGLHPLWIDTSNAQDLFEYCIWLATEGGGLWRRKHTKEVSEETVEFFIENRLRLQEISPREMQTIAEVIQNNRYDAARKQRRLAHLLHKENVDGRELRDVPIPKLVGDEGHRQWEPVPCMS